MPVKDRDLPRSKKHKVRYIYAADGWSRSRYGQTLSIETLL